MSTGFYNRFTYRMGRGETPWHTDAYRWMLLRSTSTYNFDPDHDFVSDLFTNGAVEISVPSYARQTPTNQVVTLNDTLNRSDFSMDPVSFGTLEAGQTVKAFVLYEHDAGGDGASPLVFHCDGTIRVVTAAPVVAPSTGAISAATQANPVVITSAGHQLVNGEKVKITGVVGMTELNNRIFTVAGSNIGAGTFQLSGENGLGHGAYVSGGTWKLVRIVYTIPLRDAIVDAAAVNFGGVTGAVNGNWPSGSVSIEVADLSAGIGVSVASDIQSQVTLPAILGGGSFGIGFNAAGFFNLRGWI